jgi:hypothetical protein
MDSIAVSYLFQLSRINVDDMNIRQSARDNDQRVSIFRIFGPGHAVVRYASVLLWKCGNLNFYMTR